MIGSIAERGRTMRFIQGASVPKCFWEARIGAEKDDDGWQRAAYCQSSNNVASGGELSCR